MPVLRYFVVAGAGLLALLFMVSVWLPAPVVTERDASGLDKTTIRISAEKPVAERVTIDTSVPSVTPPALSVAEQPSAPSVASDARDESQDKSRRDALARMDDGQAVAPVVTPPAPVKKVAVRKHPKRPVVMARPAGLFDLW
ncbi:MAG TPA: hypothetical protein VGC86_17865 [Afipia sp.]